MSILKRILLLGGLSLLLVGGCSSDDDPSDKKEDTHQQEDTREETTDDEDTQMEDTEQDTEPMEDTEQDTGPMEDTSGEDTQQEDTEEETSEPDTIEEDTSGETISDTTEETEVIDAEAVSISDIYGDSVSLESYVRIEDVIVTASRDRTGDSEQQSAIFVQTPGVSDKTNNGLFIRFSESYTSSIPARGDNVDLTGRVVKPYGITHLRQIQNININSSGNSLPDPVVIESPSEIATGGSKMQDYFGVLVRVEDVTVQDANPDSSDGSDYGEFAIDGSLRVASFLYEITPDPAAGDSFDYIQGPLWHSFENSKLLPRDADDVSKSSGSSNGDGN